MLFLGTQEMEDLIRSDGAYLFQNIWLDQWNELAGFIEMTKMRNIMKKKKVSRLIDLGDAFPQNVVPVNKYSCPVRIIIEVI